MRPDDLASWMREEHEKVHELKAKLREKVAVLPRVHVDDWINDVRERFEHLRAHMIRHMGLEEHAGYLDATREKRPALSAQVAKLNHEHREMGGIMDDIHRDIGQMSAKDRLLIRDACWRTEQLLSYVDHHEEQEKWLVSCAATPEGGSRD
jgi:iron-sulfur cluster repair protein YtfE (RIC family)